jgi:hypothetical protein
MTTFRKLPIHRPSRARTGGDNSSSTTRGSIRSGHTT